MKQVDPACDRGEFDRGGGGRHELDPTYGDSAYAKTRSFNAHLGRLAGVSLRGRLPSDRAKALGLTIPSSLLARADQVIE